MTSAKIHIKKTVLAAVCMAIGLVLPFLTGQIPQFGKMLLPMHLPVLLCGMICGWPYGGAVGFCLPLLRFARFGMPPMPGAISMAFELMTYGLTAGIFYALFGKKNIGLTYVGLLLSMIAGRVVWGISQIIVLGLTGKGFTLKMFLAGAFTEAVPGILLQLVLIPALMFALKRAGLLREET